MKYPVDLEARYIPYSHSQGKVIGRPARYPRRDGMEISKLNPDIVILKSVRDAEPGHNRRTHKLIVQFVVDLPAEEWRREFVIAPLDQAELDEIQERDEITAEKQQAKALYAALNTGTASNKQVQKVLAHLLRKEYGE